MAQSPHTPPVHGPSAARALGLGAPIGLLGGLLGLGGAQFRMLTLTGALGCQSAQAIAVNLPVRLITVLAALLVRGSTVAWQPVLDLLPVALTLTTVAILTGIGIVFWSSGTELRPILLWLVVAIGLVLVVDALLPADHGGLFGQWGAKPLLAAVLCGLPVGAAARLLKVPGAELIIPVLLLLFGADIVAAGTIALLVSVPTIGVATAVQARRGAYHDRTTRAAVLPMGLASVAGAVFGGLLLGAVPDAVLEFLLGVIVVVSVAPVFRR